MEWRRILWRDVVAVYISFLAASITRSSDNDDFRAEKVHGHLAAKRREGDSPSFAATQDECGRVAHTPSRFIILAECNCSLHQGPMASKMKRSVVSIETFPLIRRIRTKKAALPSATFTPNRRTLYEKIFAPGAPADRPKFETSCSLIPSTGSGSNDGGGAALRRRGLSGQPAARRWRVRGRRRRTRNQSRPKCYLKSAHVESQMPNSRSPLSLLRLERNAIASFINHEEHEQ